MADEFFDDVDDADAPAALEPSASTPANGGGKGSGASRMPPLYGSGGASDDV